jgi:hypothetical protein
MFTNGIIILKPQNDIIIPANVCITIYTRVGKYITLGGYAYDIHRVEFYTLTTRAYTIVVII